jgi:uncharacterized protein (DUF433 family)
MPSIISDPEILGGKPVIENTRLSVEHVLGLLASGMSHAQVTEAYPELTEDAIREVLRYASQALKNDIVIEIKSTREAS